MPDFHPRKRFALPSLGSIFTPGVSLLLLLMILGYSLAIFKPQFTTDYLCLNPQSCLPMKPWQLITYSFINRCFLSLFLNGLIVLFMGSAIEGQWRFVSLILLWLVVSLVCGLLWLLVNTIQGQQIIGFGSAACCCGIIGAFGLIFRRREVMVMFTSKMNARQIVLILICVYAVMAITSPILLIWVAGAGVGYLHVKIHLYLAARAGSRSPAQTRPSDGFVDID
ncbi:MAG: rhomboid family intramembrane serine protease [Sedimentisphaerales bacterium]|nr:rhomboid family intramembrane serine protease [Sedimentisphaerales bacterium]